MATLKKMPMQTVIDGYKGVLDFYYFMGIPCVRKWPAWHRRDPWPDERVNQENFAYVARMWRYLPLFIKDSYNRMAVSTNVTGRDIFIRSYLRSGRP